jgi:DNA (cytosine-5)-methyltransferase 1
MSRLVSAVDLFCGAGGLTHGLIQAGIDVKLGVDIDSNCEFPYEANNDAKFLNRSVEDITGEDIHSYFNSDGIKLLAGCAPCQTFSTYNQKACSTDKRWWLLMQFSRLVGESKPHLVTMENVPGLVNQDVFHTFVDNLEEAGYCVSYKIVNSAEFGLPQSRRRLILLASRLGEINLLSPKELGVEIKTVKDVISDLPRLKDGEIHSEDPLHQCSALSVLNKKRIRASRQGGTWRDWSEDLVADCHKKASGKSYPGVYARMSWDKPAPTMTTQYYGFGNGRFGHPEQDRAISLREGAIFQGFPKDYKFVSPEKQISKKIVGRMIGNAVPVKLGEVIGKSILAHLEKYSPSDVS